MSKPSATQSELKKSTTTEKSEVKVLAKSGWPKTPKETIKMAINFILNFFPF